MKEAFFILYIWSGSYHGGPAMLKFDTEQECLAAKKVLVEQTRDWYLPVYDRYVYCFEVKVDD